MSGFLAAEDAAEYGPKARLAADWLLDHVTPETIGPGGYFRVTGESEPSRRRTWRGSSGWTLEALTQVEELEC